MQYVQKSFAVAMGVVVAACAAQALPAQAQNAAKPASTIGVVDREKVITSFTKAQKAADELKRVEDSVRKLLEESNKQYEEAKVAKKPQAELETLQKKLQSRIVAEYKKAQSQAQSLETTLESDIDAAIKAEADSRKLDTVFMKGAVLLGGTDITDGVVKRLSQVSSSGAGTTSK